MSVFDRLIELGAQITENNYGQSILHNAAYEDNSSLLKHILNFEFGLSKCVFVSEFDALSSFKHKFALYIILGSSWFGTLHFIF